MRRIFLLIAFLGALSSPFIGHSQNQNQNLVDNLDKEYNPTSFWLALRYDQYLKSGSFFFLENNNRFQKGAQYLGSSFPLNSIYRTYFMLGYEHKAAEKWYFGLSEKYLINSFEKNFFTRINISHRGNVAKMKFIKEVALEHVSRPKSDNPNILIQNEGRFSFAPSLVKKVELMGRPLFLILHYRAYIMFDFNSDGLSFYDKRKFDKTELRVEMDYRISDKVLLSLFAIRDTDYTYRLATYGAAMNVIKEEARVNKITPTFGVSLNMVLNAPEDFLPGFPIK